MVVAADAADQESFVEWPPHWVQQSSVSLPAGHHDSRRSVNNSWGKQEAVLPQTPTDTVAAETLRAGSTTLSKRETTRSTQFQARQTTTIAAFDIALPQVRATRMPKLGAAAGFFLRLHLFMSFILATNWLFCVSTSIFFEHVLLVMTEASPRRSFCTVLLLPPVLLFFAMLVDILLDLAFNNAESLAGRTWNDWEDAGLPWLVRLRSCQCLMKLNSIISWTLASPLSIGLAVSLWMNQFGIFYITFVMASVLEGFILGILDLIMRIVLHIYRARADRSSQQLSMQEVAEDSENEDYSAPAPRQPFTCQDARAECAAMVAFYVLASVTFGVIVARSTVSFSMAVMIVTLQAVVLACVVASRAPPGMLGAVRFPLIVFFYAMLAVALATFAHYGLVEPSFGFLIAKASARSCKLNPGCEQYSGNCCPVSRVTGVARECCHSGHQVNGTAASSCEISPGTRGAWPGVLGRSCQFSAGFTGHDGVQCCCPHGGVFINRTQTATGQLIISCVGGHDAPRPAADPWTRYRVCDLMWGKQLNILDFIHINQATYSADDRMLHSVLDNAFSLTTLSDYEVTRKQPSGDAARWLEIHFKAENVTVIAIRGTATTRDFLKDLYIVLDVILLQFSFLVLPFVGLLPTTVAEHLLSMASHRGTEVIMDNSQLLRERLEELQRKNAQVVITGHSLGGLYAQVFGALYGLPIVTFSPIGQELQWRRFGLNAEQQASLDRLHVAVLPHNDFVPKIDGVIGMKQSIECGGHNWKGFRECHALVKTACELVRSCGDFKSTRDYMAGCWKWLNESDIPEGPRSSEDTGASTSDVLMLSGGIHAAPVLKSAPVHHAFPI